MTHAFQPLATHRLVPAAIAASLLLLLGACNRAPETPVTPTTSAGNQIDDTVITTRIKTALLEDPSIKSLSIDVETRKGEVILSGHADQQSQIDLAGRIATAVVGVSSVDNHLALKGPSASVGQTTDDVIVTSRVKTALLNEPLVKSFDISVTTLKGDVRLTGFVNNQAQIDRSIAVARAVEGVHSIHDELTIKK